MRVDAEYPEEWSNDVLRIAASGEDVVSEAEVPHVTRGVHRVASCRAVRDGLVARGRAYWTDPARTPRPRGEPLPSGVSRHSGVIARK